MLINQVTLVLGVFQIFFSENGNAGKNMTSTLWEEFHKFVLSLLQYSLSR